MRLLHLHAYMYICMRLLYSIPGHLGMRLLHLPAYEATVLNPTLLGNEAILYCTCQLASIPGHLGYCTHLSGPRPEALEWVPLIEDRSEAPRVLLSSDPPPPFSLSVFSAGSGEWSQNGMHLQTMYVYDYIIQERISRSHPTYEL